jgi:hypothetical protein
MFIHPAGKPAEPKYASIAPLSTSATAVGKGAYLQLPAQLEHTHRMRLSRRSYLDHCMVRCAAGSGGREMTTMPKCRRKACLKWSWAVDTISFMGANFVARELC